MCFGLFYPRVGMRFDAKGQRRQNGGKQGGKSGSKKGGQDDVCGVSAAERDAYADDGGGDELDGCGVDNKQHAGRIIGVFRFIQQICRADPVGGRRASDAQHIGGQIHTDGGKRFVVVRTKQTSGERFDDPGNFFCDAAVFPDLHQSQPDGIGSQQGDAKGGAFGRAVEQGG